MLIPVNSFLPNSASCLTKSRMTPPPILLRFQTVLHDAIADRLRVMRAQTTTISYTLTSTNTERR